MRHSERAEGKPGVEGHWPVPERFSTALGTLRTPHSDANLEPWPKVGVTVEPDGGASDGQTVDGDLPVAFRGDGRSVHRDSLNERPRLRGRK